MKPKKNQRIQASQDRRFAKLIAKIADDRLKRTGSADPIRRVGTTTTMMHRSGPAEGIQGSRAVLAALKFTGIQGDHIYSFDQYGNAAKVLSFDRAEWSADWSGSVVERERFGKNEFDAGLEYVWFKKSSAPNEDGDA